MVWQKASIKNFATLKRRSVKWLQSAALLISSGSFSVSVVDLTAIS